MSQWMLEPLQNAADEACEEPEGGARVGAPASRSLQLPRIEIKESNSFFILAVREACILRILYSHPFPNKMLLWHFSDW